jgi:nitrogen-specific signal transduction histidine kinase/CheY-like chemotaxis protein
VVASRWTLLCDAEGRPRSKLVINTDITEKKKTEDKLLRAQRLENIGRLAGGIAHDLNNILAPLSMGVEMLEKDCADPADRSLLAAMHANLHRGADLVRQIVTFARGLGGERRPLALGPLIGELAGLFRQTFPRSIAVETAVPEALWRVNADPTQVHQVLTNLCVNARDAMPRGGRLRILAGNRQLDERGALLAGGLAPGAYVVLEVEDTGTGIPADVLGRIFEPFYTTKAPGLGTGLGLSTAHDIVRNHGGAIRVDSEVGKGTRFSVYLPAHEADQAVPAEPDRRELPGGKGEVLLVVDDEAALLHIARLTLTAAGYQVLTAGQGAEALALYAQRPGEIGAVLTDLMMPVLDGAATVRGLERLNPAVRVIVVSGLLTGEEAARAGGPAVKAFLPKPYTAEALLATVRSVLDS